MLAPVINFLDLPADMQQNIVDALNIYEASTWAKVSKSGRQFVKGRMECVLALTHYPFNMGINELYTINKIRVTGIELNDIITLTKALTSGGLANLKELRVFNILGLAENQAGDDGLKALAEPLSKGALDKLTVLHLNDNQFTDDGFAIIMPYLRKGGKLSNLTEFSIGTGITDKGMKKFADILSKGALPQCTYINLEKNQIGDKGLEAFAGALSKGALANLNELYFYSNKIGDKGLEAFADALSKETLAQLTVLDLRYNKIGDDGLKALAESLSKGALANVKELCIDDHAAKQQLEDVCNTRSIFIIHLYEYHPYDEDPDFGVEYS